MRLTTLFLIWIVRIAAFAQLVLGVLFWTGRSIQLIPLHISIGFLVVWCLWALSILALLVRVGRGLALFGLLWGIALPAVGLPQATLLVGSWHWIIRVTHLVMAVSAVAVANTLAKRIVASRPTQSTRLEIAG